MSLSASIHPERDSTSTSNSLGLSFGRACSMIVVSISFGRVPSDAGRISLVGEAESAKGEYRSDRSWADILEI